MSRRQSTRKTISFFKRNFYI